jgi:hypothetical protein
MFAGGRSEWYYECLEEALRPPHSSVQQINTKNVCRQAFLTTLAIYGTLLRTTLRLPSLLLIVSGVE